jgi:hypothetical protein
MGNRPSTSYVDLSRIQKTCRLRSRTLANHAFRFMWSPEKGRTDIEKEVEVEVDVPTRVRVQYGAMTECDSMCRNVSPAVC